MSIEGRLESLERRRKELHDKVEALEAEKAPEKYITPLKRQKLQLKDDIAHLRRTSQQ
jgi:hypothetical protein